TIVLKSTFAGGEALNLAPLVVDEITVIGSRCGPFRDAIRALSTTPGTAGHVDVSALVSGRFDLRDGLDALEAAGRSENLKILIDMSK
ncbi:MAG: alcohol dehydrogenase, partial [Planctomycetota bacterium]